MLLRPKAEQRSDPHRMRNARQYFKELPLLQNPRLGSLEKKGKPRSGHPVIPLKNSNKVRW